MLPITRSVSKMMLPIGSKPIVHFAVDEAIDSGLNEHLFITKHGDETIEHYFDFSNISDLEAGYFENLRKSEFSFIKQSEPKGLGNAILHGKEFTESDDAFMVILPDDLCVSNHKPITTQLLDIYNEYKCTIVAIERVSTECIQRHGAVVGSPMKGNIFRVDNIIEKPRSHEIPSNHALIGRFVLTSSIFDEIENSKVNEAGESTLTEAIARLAKKEVVLAVEIDGHSFDCGHKDTYFQAIEYMKGTT